MTKKNICLIVVAAVLATVYVVYFTDWFKPKTVQIFHTSRNLRLRAALRDGVTKVPPPTLIFAISRQVKLTEIKVVPAAEFQTNRNAVPVWHLVSDSNSIPTKDFIYGQFIRGMRPAVKGARAQTLETNITYHLMLKGIGSVNGEHNFELN